MIEAILRHHLIRAEAGERFNGIANCHVRGLHSIMLSDAAEGNRMRLFYTTPDHVLHNRGGRLAGAIHRHHCDITLIGVSGTLINCTYDEPIADAQGEFFACEYRSGIGGKAASLTVLEGRYSLQARGLYDMHGRSVHMGADELHTVWVAECDQSAWLVLEGREVGPRAICYTNNPTWETEGLYQTMSQETVQVALRNVLRGAVTL